MLSYQLSRMYHLPEFPLLHSTSMLTKIRAGYSFEEASTLKQVGNADKPILFIHGEADTFVPVEMVHRLYKETKSEKELFLVANAEHGNAYDANQKGYEKAVTDFLGTHIR